MPLERSAAEWIRKGALAAERVRKGAKSVKTASKLKYRRIRLMSKNSTAITRILTCAATVIGGLQVVNTFLKKEARSSNLLRTDHGRFYRWKYGDVFYRVVGEGREPLLLLHSTGEIFSSYEWHAVISQLRRNYRLYIPDLPGCGRSDKPGLEYTNYLYVSFVSSFIRDVINRDNISVAASGLSASFAVTAAHVHPSLIGRLILISPASLEKLARVPNQKSRKLRTLLGIPLIGELLYHMITDRRNIEYYLREEVYFNPFRLSEQAVTVCHEAANTGHGSGRFLRASLDGRLFNWNLKRSLGLLTQDVFILSGECGQDSKKIASSYREYCPAAKIIYISSSGRLPQLDNPAGFVQAFPDPPKQDRE